MDVHFLCNALRAYEIKLMMAGKCWKKAGGLKVKTHFGWAGSTMWQWSTLGELSVA